MEGIQQPWAALVWTIVYLPKHSRELESELTQISQGNSLRSENSYGSPDYNCLIRCRTLLTDGVEYKHCSQPGRVQYKCCSQPGRVEYERCSQLGRVQYKRCSKPGRVEYERCSQPGRVEYKHCSQPGRVEYKRCSQLGTTFSIWFA